MSDGGFDRPYRLRKPFLIRGLGKISNEWAMLCTAHNLRKLAAIRTA